MTGAPRAAIAVFLALAATFAIADDETAAGHPADGRAIAACREVARVVAPAETVDETCTAETAEAGPACQAYIDCRRELAASAAMEWKDAFAAICGEVERTPELSEAHLAILIAASDVLEARIEASGARDAKIYLFRLRKCRDLFRYSLDLREDDPPEP